MSSEGVGVRVAWLGSGVRVNASLEVTKLSDMLRSLPGILKTFQGIRNRNSPLRSSPEGSLCLSSDESSGGCLELCWRHPHGLLHLSRGGGDEVLVNVSAQPLLPQDPPDQLNGGTDGLLSAAQLWTESLVSSRPGKTREESYYAGLDWTGLD